MKGKALVVDVHTHLYLPRYMDLLRKRTAVPRIFNRGAGDRLVILPDEDKDPSTAEGRPIGTEYHDINVKLAFMKLHSIDRSVLSLANPWLDFLPANEAVQMASDLNNDLNDICTSNSKFYGFGVLPTLSVEGSIKELQRIAGMKRMVGVILGTNGLGNGLDDPNLEPVLQKAADLKLTMFLHPHYSVPSSLFGRRQNGHVLPLALGFPFETSIAVSRMILAGVFDRIPTLKMLLAHSGGVLPYLAGRLDSCVEHDAHLANFLKKSPSEYLKLMYYDAVTYQPASLNCVASLVGSDRLMFGTDNPFFPPLCDSGEPWKSVQTNYDAIEQIKEAQEAILGLNACRVLGIE